MASSSVVPFAPAQPAIAPLPSRRAMRWGAFLGVMVLVLALADGWMPRVVHEAGRAPATRSASLSDADLGAAVERVAHTPAAVAGSAGTLAVTDRAYHATFDRSGYSYAPTGSTSSFDVGLSSIERGATSIPLRLEAWGAHDNTVVREVSPGIRERVIARTGEVEWDVVLTAPPAGHGALRVGADLDGVEGTPARITTAGGPAWRFALEGGGTALMDEIVVKDATGATVYRGLPQVSHDAVTLVVPSSVLDGAIYPLTIDPTVAGPTQINNLGYNPAIAFNGTDYVAVWEQLVGGDSDILGVRLDTNGQRVGNAFAVTGTTKPETHADISWNGSQFLVVYELQNTGAFPDNDYDIWGARLNSVGGKVGTNFVVHAGNLGDRRWDNRHPAVTTDSLDWYVAYEDNANYPSLGWDIYSKTVTRNGVVGLATTIATSAKDELGPDVAWNGGTYLVTFGLTYAASDHDVLGQRISPFIGFTLDDGTKNGEKFGGTITIQGSSAEQLGAGIASEGADLLPCDSCANPQTRGKPYFVAWADYRNGTADVYGTLLNNAGGVVSPAGNPITTGPRGQAPGSKTVAFNGVYLVAWLDIGPDSPYPRGIYANRVDKSGNRLDGNGFTVSDTSAIEQSAAVSRGDGSRWGVAYENYATGSTSATVQLKRVSPK